MDGKWDWALGLEGSASPVDPTFAEVIFGENPEVSSDPCVVEVVCPALPMFADDVTRCLLDDEQTLAPFRDRSHHGGQGQELAKTSPSPPIRGRRHHGQLVDVVSAHGPDPRVQPANTLLRRWFLR